MQPPAQLLGAFESILGNDGREIPQPTTREAGDLWTEVLRSVIQGGQGPEPIGLPEPKNPEEPPADSPPPFSGPSAETDEAVVVALDTLAPPAFEEAETAPVNPVAPLPSVQAPRDELPAILRERDEPNADLRVEQIVQRLLARYGSRVEPAGDEAPRPPSGELEIPLDDVSNVARPSTTERQPTVVRTPPSAPPAEAAPTAPESRPGVTARPGPTEATTIAETTNEPIVREPSPAPRQPVGADSPAPRQSVGADSPAPRQPVGFDPPAPRTADPSRPADGIETVGGKQPSSPVETPSGRVSRVTIPEEPAQPTARVAQPVTESGADTARTQDLPGLRRPDLQSTDAAATEEPAQESPVDRPPTRPRDVTPRRYVGENSRFRETARLDLGEPAVTIRTPARDHAAEETTRAPARQVEARPSPPADPIAEEQVVRETRPADAADRLAATERPVAPRPGNHVDRVRIVSVAQPTESVETTVRVPETAPKPAPAAAKPGSMEPRPLESSREQPVETTDEAPEADEPAPVEEYLDEADEPLVRPTRQESTEAARRAYAREAMHGTPEIPPATMRQQRRADRPARLRGAQPTTPAAVSARQSGAQDPVALDSKVEPPLRAAVTAAPATANETTPEEPLPAPHVDRDVATEESIEQTIEKPSQAPDTISREAAVRIVKPLPRPGTTAARPVTGTHVTSGGAASTAEHTTATGSTGSGTASSDSAGRLHHMALAEAIAARARSVPREGSVELRFDLEPDDLGPVRVHIESRGEQLKIRIVAASGGAVDTLSSGVSRLSSQLSEAGFRDAQVEVTLDNGGHPEARGQRDETGPRGRGARTARAAQVSPEEVSRRGDSPWAASSRLDRTA